MNKKFLIFSLTVFMISILNLFNNKELIYFNKISKVNNNILNILDEKYLSLKNEFYDTNEIEVTKFNEKKYVYPLGKVVGVKATTEGVLVIGHEDDSVEYIGGIKIGDSIIKINDEKIENVEQISNILSKTNDDKIKVTVKRDGEVLEELVKIKINDKNKRLGFWVRDKISGIGTMTFFDPESNIYKGIGHPITDSDTNELLDIKHGNLYLPKSLKVNKSNKNKVGFLEGEFDFLSPIGNFDNNNKYGINANLNLENKSHLIEVATKEDIKLGDAYILFEDEYINSYLVEIIDINFKNDYNKQILIKIKDEKLLDYTGGIVQGMSGSPLIQNNKIIGALTHVFKEDTKKGYCIFIGEMLE